MIFTIPGNPIPLKRHRHSKSGTYDPQKAEKLYCGLLLKQQYSALPLLGPLHLELRFFMPIPKIPKKYQMVSMPHYLRPDCDNLIKFILDCANNILYKDDCQISSLFAIKVYDNRTRTEITIIKEKHE